MQAWTMIHKKWIYVWKIRVSWIWNLLFRKQKYLWTNRFEFCKVALCKRRFQAKPWNAGIETWNRWPDSFFQNDDFAFSLSLHLETNSYYLRFFFLFCFQYTVNLLRDIVLPGARAQNTNMIYFFRIFKYMRFFALT